MVHPLLPLVLLAGLGVGRLGHAAMGARRTGIAVAAVAAGLVVTLGVATSLAVQVDHREPSAPLVGVVAGIAGPEAAARPGRRAPLQTR